MTRAELLRCVMADISSDCGIMRTINGVTSPHKGTDICTYVRAAGAGKVLAVLNNVPNSHTGLNVATSLAGNYIWIEHANGWVSKYMHLGYASVRFKVGDKVAEGQILAIVGNTGQSSNAHVHIQFELNGVWKHYRDVPKLTAPVDKPATPASATNVKIDMAVRVKAGSNWTTGSSVPAFVLEKTMYIVGLQKNNTVAVISPTKGGEVTGAIAVTSLYIP